MRASVSPGGQDRLIVVTGHDGFIGAVLTETLLARGYRVRGLDTQYFGAGPAAPSRSLEVVVTDVRDVCADDLDGAYAVIHLAALSNDPMGALNLGLTFEINSAASVRLARLAKVVGTQRFVFSSSCSVYGVHPDRAATESSDCRPQTAYAASKLRAEQEISALADDSFSPTFLRNSTAYGLSNQPRLDLVLNNFVGWAVTTKQVRIMSDGTPWRPLVHVQDLADAFVAAVEAPRASVHSQVLNVGQNLDNYRVREVAETVRRVVPGSRIVYANGAPVDVRSYRVDFSKVRRLLPTFQPTRTIEQGAREVYEWARLTGLTADEFNSARFMRLRRLEELRLSGAVGSDLRWVAANRTRRSTKRSGFVVAHPEF